MIGGIFVGGRGTRMGGVAKGLLRTDSGETLIARMLTIFRLVGIEPVLVGEHEAYVDLDLGVPMIPDAVKGIGPLGGLIALLEHGESAIAIACDMPFVSEKLVRKLTTVDDGTTIAPKRDGKWEPLFARYDASVLETARTHAREGKHSLQALLDAVKAEELALDPSEQRELEDRDR